MAEPIIKIVQLGDKEAFEREVSELVQDNWTVVGFNCQKKEAVFNGGLLIYIALLQKGEIKKPRSITLEGQPSVSQR